MSNAFSLRCIYLSCKVLYFILSDDDFEIKSKIYSFNLRLVLKHILHSQDVLYFFKLSAGHGFWFIMTINKENVNKSCVFVLAWVPVCKYKQ